MKLSFIPTGYLKLDGGAMFGVVPKQLWQRLNPPDEQNLCTWAMRCLLIETADRKILVDTGIGNKQDERFRSHFHPHGEATLLGSLAARGLAPADITDVLLTHLHFDHVGGALMLDAQGHPVPTFPNATYWSNERHWRWAMEPNPREAASFLKENFLPLQTQGRVQFLDVQDDDLPWLPGIKLRFVYGHTEAMMLPIIEHAGQTLVYAADLLPSSYHLGLPYVMSYDVRPLLTLEEKARLLADATAGNWIIAFEHDPRLGATRLQTNEKGRWVAGEEVDLAGFG
ncbi:MAG: MBL fold metallo-hydrolase [Bacteroidetes bacterium]|nr:MAG: MBL fold metallo-hydrolase [Bacteroidota bacterium]